MPGSIIAKSLDELAGKMVVEGGEPDHLIKLSDAQLRREVALRVGWLFLLTNAFVVTLIAACFGFDVHFLKSMPNPPPRLVDQTVLQTLLGATTVQLGIVMIAIVGYLFPRRPLLDRTVNRAGSEEA